MYRQFPVSVYIVLCGSIVLGLAATARAQFKAGVQGTVTDETGAAIPAAKVTLTSDETGRTQQVMTGGQGFYHFSGLPPGRYTISVEQAGFKKKVLKGITVSAEEVRGVNIRLQPGEIVETVTVRAGGKQPLHTETGSVTTVITTEEVRRLPQFGRDPYELLRLAPGVFGDGAREGNGNAVELPNNAGPGGSDTSVFQVENQVQISANGQRVSANNFQIDGVSVNSLGFGGAAVVTPNQESVKEIRVLSSSYSAEDGRNSGAQVKVVTQNGTNQYHGSAVFKLNDPGLNAFNKFGGITGDPNVNAPPVRVENRFRQFAASLGGPIVKDKLFFFFSYEGIRNNTSNTFDEWVETPEFRQLVIDQRPDGVTAQIFRQPGMEPRMVSLLPADCSIFGNDPTRCQQVPGGLDIGSLTRGLGQYVPRRDATGGGLDGIPDIQFARIALPSKTRGNQYNARVDFNLSPSQRFAVSSFITGRNDDLSDRGARSRPSSDLNFQPLNSAATMTWISIISPTMVNEARANFTRFAFNQIDSNPAVNFGIPRVEVEGLPFDRIRFGADRSEATPAKFAQNTFEFRDTLSLVLGNKVLKFGFEFRPEQDNSALAGGARPIYSFTGLFNLANDTPIFEAINADPRTGGPADAQRYFRTKNYALFVQDDWKVRPNLTFNLGLRYEVFTPPSERRGRLSNLIFPPGDLLNARVKLVNKLFSTDFNNFGPRLGFAWSPTRFKDKLVLRGGYGISYNRIPNVLFTNTRGNPPFFARFNICCGTAGLLIDGSGSPFAGGQILYALGSNSSPFSFPVNPALGKGLDPVTGGVRGSAVEIWGAEGEVPNAYVYTYSLDMEYALPFRLVASIGYQGSSSHKLIRIVNQNFIFQPNRQFFRIFFPQPDVNANFNALNARLTRRLGEGFQIEANYRWSKSIDTLSNEGPGAQTNQTFPEDLASERGPSDFDVTHFFTLSGLWELPIFRRRTGFLGKALGGWQLNGILTARSGFPWTVKLRKSIRTPSGEFVGPIRPTRFFGGNLNDHGDDAFIRPGGNFPGGGARFFDLESVGPPGIGRNTFRGPRFSALDLSLVKQTALPNFGLGEEANLEIRVNFFNALNSLNLSNFGFFSTGVFAEDPNFGRAERGLAGRVIEFQARFSF